MHLSTSFHWGYLVLDKRRFLLGRGVGPGIGLGEGGVRGIRST